MALSNYATPQDCDMIECRDLLTGWALGENGYCMKDYYGIKIGPNGFKVVVMEVRLAM